jgi:hypothetical protein
MSTLILCHPCHPWAFPIQNGVFLQWTESSVILCHPMSSLGNHILTFMFFAGHMVKCHPVSSHIDLEAISMKNACLRCGKQPAVIPCHPCAISKQNRRYCSIKNLSSVILCHPCHPWAFPIQNVVFLQWTESSVILCHPMSSLGNHILTFMFFAGHMVKCHPVSSHIDLEAISLQNACLRCGKQPGVIPCHPCAISKQNSRCSSMKYV